MADTWWMPMPGPEGESWEVSSDGTQLHIDGFVFEVVDAPAVGMPAAGWHPSHCEPAGWV